MSTDDTDLFEIDLDRLDEAWVQQPKLYHEWSTKLAEAKKDLEQAKARLSLVEAELFKSIRKNPSRYGVEKDTDSAVKAAIPMTDKHKTAVKRVISAQYDVNTTDAVVKTLEHRKRSLEGLVSLHGQQYFATPRGNSRELEADMKQKAARRRTKRGPTRKKKRSS